MLTAASAEPAAAKHRVPLNGFIQAVEESITLLPPEVPAPTLLVDANGGGRATVLGRYSVRYEVEVDLETFFGTGSAEFVSASGGRLFTETEGQGTVPTEDGISFIVESHRIKGGTGRFRGASGRFLLWRVINVFTGETCGSFAGTIQLK
jgi:hypothetical protein